MAIDLALDLHFILPIEKCQGYKVLKVGSCQGKKF
jgi:hypothetical protein